MSNHIKVRDPFSLKRHPKWYPTRIGYTLYARWQERAAQRGFASFALPEVRRPNLPTNPPIDQQHTEVQPEQLSHLLAALQATESLTGTCGVEIGAFRGETAATLAAATRRPYFLVDPYIGYGGSDADFARMSARIAGIPNAKHLRQTSGEAALGWTGGPVSFAFIDAVHDYVNVRFDLSAWSRHVVPGGMIALHDTDNPLFAGVRRAVSELVPAWDVFAHVPDLVVLAKR